MPLVAQKQAPVNSNSSQPDHNAGSLTACRALFAQLPWEDIDQLDADSIRAGVQLPLINFLQHLALAAAAGNADAADLMQSTITVACRLLCCKRMTSCNMFCAAGVKPSVSHRAS